VLYDVINAAAEFMVSLEAIKHHMGLLVGDVIAAKD
jgi:hypothetical protein